MEPSTKSAILDAAERLFAERGFDAASLREITTAAGVNLAAVNYHFGSKEGLIRTMFVRRLEPMNRTRLERLRSVVETARGEDREPTLEEVLTAFFEPALRMANEPHGNHFLRILGRMHADPDAVAQRDQIYEQFRDLRDRFLPILGACTPHLDPAEFLWRAHFTIGAMAHAMTCKSEIEWLSGGAHGESNVDATVARLVAFCAAGLRAPAPQHPEEQA